MIRILKMLFTWWNDQTLGTLLITRRRGKLVGIDAQGNCYYEDKHGASINGKTRRWVLYNGDIETTRISLNGTVGCTIRSMKRLMRLIRSSVTG